MKSTYICWLVPHQTWADACLGGFGFTGAHIGLGLPLWSPITMVSLFLTVSSLHLMILYSILEFGYESFFFRLCLVIFLLITFLALTASNDHVSVKVLGQFFLFCLEKWIQGPWTWNHIVYTLSLSSGDPSLSFLTCRCSLLHKEASKNQGSVGRFFFCFFFIFIFWCYPSLGSERWLCSAIP